MNDYDVIIRVPIKAYGWGEAFCDAADIEEKVQEVVDKDAALDTIKCTKFSKKRKKKHLACDRCGGSGVLTLGDTGWICPTCEGNGHV